MRQRALAASVLFGCLGIFELHAATLHVDRSSTNPIPPFASWATAAASIQGAVDAADSNDTVLVNDGHYVLSSEIMVSNAVHFVSANGPDQTIVDGNGTSRCFNISSSFSTVTGFTVTNAYKIGINTRGGGIACLDETSVISNCVIVGNEGENGGGIYYGTVVDCIITNNRADSYGGGLYRSNVSDSLILDNKAVSRGGGLSWGTAENCIIVRNIGSGGGGIHNGTAIECSITDNIASSGGGGYDADIERCTVENNIATVGHGGGALYGDISYSIIRGNRAEDGSGVSHADIKSSVVSDNHGGAAVNVSDVDNCTIVYNPGGGVDSGTVQHSIIWGNTIAGNLNFDDFNQTIEYSCAPELVHGVDGNITNNPLLVTASHIATNSPCRGAGGFSVSGADIDGEPWQNPPSMGCDEIHNTVTGIVHSFRLTGPGEIRTGLDATYLADIDGPVTETILDLGDGTLYTNQVAPVKHSWDTPGVYNVVFTAYNNQFPAGVSFTQTVDVILAASHAVYVSVATGDDGNDGLTWATAKQSIQSGLDTQDIYGGLVLISNGTYSVDSEIVIDKTLMLFSLNGPDVTIMDGNGSNRCISANASDCVISGFTLTNGHVGGFYDYGGGIYCSNDTTIVSNCLFVGNAASSGGGMYHGTAIDCIFSSNSALRGGGMAYGSAIDSDFNGNTAYGDGGALYGVEGIRCSIVGNTAADEGGGIFGGTAIDCTIEDNAASRGGGMYWVTATNCMIIANSAGNEGSGMYEGSATYCTVSSNAASFGSGMRHTIANHCIISDNMGIGVLEGAATNCIVTGNSGHGMQSGPAYDCIFSNNSGSGLYSGAADLCTFEYNAGSGMNGGTAYRCTFEGNGGSGMNGGTAELCSFVNNSATYGGGMRSGTATRCAFMGNSATYGGGLYQSTANSCYIVDNVASSRGGGMDRGTANNSTLTGNTAGSGGGIYNGTANNSIIWYNTADEGTDLYQGNTYYSCSPGVEHGVDGNITNNPLLVSVSHIGTNSPCRGAGSLSYVSGTDIDGEEWLSPPSIGCDEVHGSVTGAVHLSISGPLKIRDNYAGAYFFDILGPVTGQTVDFGDGNIVTNMAVFPPYAWTVPGIYDVILTAYNDDFTSGVSYTQQVEVLSEADSTIHVSDATGSDLNDGASWSSAKQSIQAGVDAQDVYGGIVLVSNGTYHIASEITVQKVITVQALSGPEVTTVDGGGASRCFNLGDSMCNLSGFTLTNGYTVDSGGAVYCADTSPVVSNCVLVGNTAIGTGGGISSGTALQCALSNNAGGNGGALYNTLAENCSITGNSAEHGGGVYGGTIVDCTISGNSAGEYGGGVNRSIVSGSRVIGNVAGNNGGGLNESTANNCIIAENITGNDGGGMHYGNATHCSVYRNIAAGLGGGISYADAGNCMIAGNFAVLGGGMSYGSATNSVIFGNEAAYMGGGVDRTRIYNCTITGNSAMYGGGAYYYGSEVRNSILWGNYSDVGEGIAVGPYPPTMTDSCSPYVQHGVDGNITNVPLLVSASHIATYSPCIGAGNVAYTSGSDIDGEPWLTPPSIGCDEVHSPVEGAIELSVLGPVRTVPGLEVKYIPMITGPITHSRMDFGDGTIITNAIVQYHTWPAPGRYDMILTAYNDDFAGGVSFTQEIEVVSVTDSTIYVSDVVGYDTNDGSAWTAARKTIQSGVDAQDVYGGLVLVSNGTYSVDEEIMVSKYITLKGVGGPESTVVYSSATNRCFKLMHNACVLDGFTITNGYQAGMFPHDEGGGIYSAFSTALITNCIISGNAAGQGGGVYGGTVDDCTITGNVAEFGGGLHSSYVSHSTISSNEVSYSGGGVYNCTVSHSILTGNVSEYYGGAMTEGTAFNCVVYGNASVPGRGGGVYDGVVYNSTITENAADHGGGMYQGTAYNSIIWNNNAPLDPNAAYVAATNSCSLDLLHGVVGNITNAPRFVNVSTGNFRLQAQSPCINAGGNVYVNDNADLGGNPRIITGVVDMGAYEAPDITSHYMITTSADSNGTIVPANPSVFAGYDQPISILPDSGYYVESLAVDGAGVTPAELYVFNNVQSNHSIAAAFAVAYYSLNVVNGIGDGSYTIFPAIDIAADEPPPGSVFLKWSVDPPQYSGNLGDLYSPVTTMQMPEDDVVLTATYGPIYYADASRSDDSGDGLTWATAKQTIQSAVDIADEGGLVLVTNGTYATGLKLADGQLTTNRVCVDKALTLKSVNGPDVTFIMGAKGSNGGHDTDSVRGVYLADHAVLSGFTITNGFTADGYDEHGGGVCSGDEGVVTNCILVGNAVSRYGGGAYGGTLHDSILDNNTAGNSGGGAASADLNNCSLINNTSLGSGGGAYSGTLNQCIVSNNTASGSGGGTYYGSAVSSVLIDNYADADGGGTYRGVLDNCIVRGNEADDSGGGSYNGTLNNCTIVQNSAGRFGIAAYSGTLNNCIIWDNAGGGGRYYIRSVTARYSCSPYASDGIVVVGDPLFVDEANGDFKLQTNSPCINAGHNDYVVGTTDVDGDARIIYGVVDIGAQEYSGPVQGMPDFDGDGLADTWEGFFFGSTSEDPDGHADSDGASNEEEYIAGTDPTNAASYFHVTTDTAASTNPSPYIVINWEAVTGRVYNVLWTPSLTESFQPLEIGIQYPQNSYTDTVHVAESTGFYRVVVMRADDDMDGDGLPNDWEEQYGATNADGDNDGDGSINISEFIAGTDPTNAASFFAVSDHLADVGGTNCFVVEWISVPDRSYSIWWSTNLPSGFLPLAGGIAFPQNSYTDTMHHAEATGCYKVEVRKD